MEITKNITEMEDFIIMTLQKHNSTYCNKKIENPILLEKIYILFFTKDSTTMDLEYLEPLYCGIYYAKIEKNWEQAKFWYEKAAELGNASAMNNLGSYCYKIKNDFKQAKCWYEKGAELGDTNAMVNLGSYYKNIKNDFKQAKYWFEKAAILGDKNALKNYFQLCSLNKVFYHDLFNNVSLETIENQFPKFKHFWNGRKKFITNDDCNICYDEKKDLIPFDCLQHSYCLSCYITIDKCAHCEIKKNESFKNYVLFS